MRISYRSGLIPSTEAIAALSATAKPQRPLVDNGLIEKMYANAQLVVTAWHEDELIGIARVLTDFCSSCFIADIIVNDHYKCAGIGRRLIEETRKHVGEGVEIILLSPPSLMQFYERIGMEKIDNGFKITDRHG